MRRFTATFVIPAESNLPEIQKTFSFRADGWTSAAYKALDEVERTTLTGYLLSLTEER